MYVYIISLYPNQITAICTSEKQLRLTLMEIFKREDWIFDPKGTKDRSVKNLPDFSWHDVRFVSSEFDRTKRITSLEEGSSAGRGFAVMYKQSDGTDAHWCDVLRIKADMLLDFVGL